MNNKYNIEYLKQNSIDVSSSIELLGDIETYNDTLKTFLDESSDKTNKIKDSKENNNLSDYSIYVHSLKSDSKYLGFKKLADLSLEHELKSKEGDLDYVNNHYDELINEYDNVIKIVREYLEG